MNEYNIYDIQACKNAITAIREFPITCRVKNQHKAKLCELKKVIDDYCFQLNSALFGDDNCDIADYKQAVLIYYNEITKADLDNKLRLVVQRLINRVQSCIGIEYQTQDGRLVPHPRIKGYWIDKDRLEEVQ